MELNRIGSRIQLFDWLLKDNVLFYKTSIKRIQLFDMNVHTNVS